jgi:hypothetical protein
MIILNYPETHPNLGMPPLVIVYNHPSHQTLKNLRFTKDNYSLQRFYIC